MKIVTIEDRDNALHELYNVKNYHIFFFGEENFNKKVRDIHFVWVNGYDCKTPWGNDMAVEQICWEDANGYLEEAI